MKIWQVVGGMMVAWVVCAYPMRDEDIVEAVRRGDWISCTLLSSVEDKVFAMRCAIESNNLELIKLIYENISRELRSHHINFLSPYTGHSLSDYTLLAVAVFRKRAKIVRWLINHKADASVQMSTGKTALMIALERCYYGIACDLIKTGRGINAVDNQGRTAFIYALKRYNDDPKTTTKIVEMLAHENAYIAPEHYQNDTGFCLCNAVGGDELVIIEPTHELLRNKVVSTFLQNSIRFGGEVPEDERASLSGESVDSEANDEAESEGLGQKLLATRI